MIEVQMTDDIRKYETKALGPFTARQIICIIIAAIVVLPLIFLDIPWDNRMLIMLFVAVPIVSCGYVKMDGMYFEVLVFRFLYYFFLTPKKRKVVRKNTFREWAKEYEALEKKKKLSKLTKKQQEAYKKHEIDKKKKKNIKYSTKKEYKIYH